MVLGVDIGGMVFFANCCQIKYIPCGCDLSVCDIQSNNERKIVFYFATPQDELEPSNVSAKQGARPGFLAFGVYVQCSLP